MPQPSTREELKQYCLRKLGAPVIEINVDDSQLEDRLDEAIELYTEYHYDGVERRYYKHQVTQEDIDRANGDLNGGYISTDGIDPSIVSIVRLFQFSESSIKGSFESTPSHPIDVSISEVACEFCSRGKKLEIDNLLYG